MIKNFEETLEKTLEKVLKIQIMSHLIKIVILKLSTYKEFIGNTTILIS